MITAEVVREKSGTENETARIRAVSDRQGFDYEPEPMVVRLATVS